MTNKERELVREACKIIAREAREGRVTIQGFGSFTRVERKARIARNPKTGETVEVLAKETLKFKPSKDQED